MPDNTRTCACTVQQYSPIIFNSVAYQNSANTVYQSKNATVVAAQNGTLGNRATGNPVFNSNYERMQYLLGRKNQECGGVAQKAFFLGGN